mgnify:FL=1
MSNLLGVMQEIMQENQKAMKPTEVAFGTVATVSPLSLLVDGTSQPKSEAGLILTEAVIPKTVQVQGGGGMVVVNKGLAVGDKVVMLRVSRGNRYIVLSKAQ